MAFTNEQYEMNQERYSVLDRQYQEHQNLYQNLYQEFQEGQERLKYQLQVVRDRQETLAVMEAPGSQYTSENIQKSRRSLLVMDQENRELQIIQESKELHLYQEVGKIQAEIQTQIQDIERLTEERRQIPDGINLTGLRYRQNQGRLPIPDNQRRSPSARG